MNPSQTSRTFEVRRAGSYEDRLAPCDDAQAAKVRVYDRRTFKTPEEHDARFPMRPWLSAGTEHDTWTNGRDSGIRRRMEDRDGWVLDADALDLVVLSAQYGSVTIEPPEAPDDLPKLVLGRED